MLDVKKLLTKMLTAIKTVSYDSGEETVYSNYCKCRRIGKVVQVWGQSNNGWSITSGAYRALTTLPQQYRPPQEVRFVCGAVGGTSEITGYVATNGIIYLYTTSTTAYWNFSITYFVS